jgi:hypothetical protein
VSSAAERAARAVTSRLAKDVEASRPPRRRFVYGTVTAVDSDASTVTVSIGSAVDGYVVPWFGTDLPEVGARIALAPTMDGGTDFVPVGVPGTVAAAPDFTGFLTSNAASLTVGPTAPVSPAVNDLWVDTS